MSHIVGWGGTWMMRPETGLGRVKFWEDRAKEGLVPKLGSTGPLSALPASELLSLQSVNSLTCSWVASYRLRAEVWPQGDIEVLMERPSGAGGSPLRRAGPRHPDPPLASTHSFLGWPHLEWLY